MSQTVTKIPEYFNVNLGNLSYEIETETLISSMAHQFISKTTNLNTLENYDVIYNVTKTEIEDYLKQKVKNSDLFVDLFGNWSDDFKKYHAEKNEPICRDISFEFTDGSKWLIKVLDILALKNTDDEFDLDDPILKDDEKLMDLLNSYDWEDIKHIAEEIARPQPELNLS